MPVKIDSPTRISATGNKPKVIDEFIGRVNTSTDNISIARMKSPAGWEEPGQTPEFDEYTIVLKGLLRIETKEKIYDIKAGEGIITFKGEWIRYSTPMKGGAEYIAVCIPAFSPESVNRD
jgi:mannose-6-phosphate isomerase-like protein (cupin superfamily)